MVNIAAIEKSIMTADEKTLKEMAGNIGMEFYQQLSPEAKQRLSGVIVMAQPTNISKEEAIIELSIYTLVKQLREAAEHHKKAIVMLPTEIVSLIEGRTQEAKFENISVGKVLQYIADMLEE